MPLDLSARILVAVVVLTAAFIDFRSRRIPNWLTLPAACMGLLLNFKLSGLAGLTTSAEGLLVGFASYFALYCLHAMGAGDVKLMAAVGAIVGLHNWFSIFLATAVAGGVMALVLVIWKGRLRQTLSNSVFIVGELTSLRAPHQRDQALNVKDPRALNMAHGLAIAAGTLACMALAII